MDTRTLKRLFPFLGTGKPCTKEQAAALALCATGDRRPRTLDLVVAPR